MKRKNQLNLLIISCTIILLGLFSIQYYLVRNTYELISQTYITNIKKEISPVIDSPEMDSIESQVVDELKILCLNRVKDSITVKEFHSKINKIAERGREKSQSYLKSQFKDYPLLKEIKIRIQVEQILFETNNIYDTLLKSTDKPIIILGETSNGKAFQISSGITQSSIEREKDSINAEINYFYKHHQSTCIDISNFQSKIWEKMKWILIAAVILILFVIFLFFWMYRSLIKQKKIAELKTDFANNISHELKTPVSSLSLAIKSLKIEEINQNPQKLKELIAALERQSNRIQSLTEKVLESSDEYKIQLQKMDIILFLKGIISDFKSDRHTLKSELEPTNLFLNTDYYLLERVLQNLLENAQKYSPNASEIKLKSHIYNSEFIVEISDNGMGISPKEQGKIFDKFYRIPEGNRHNIKGLGLGLFLSKNIMESLGGSITVNSKLGKGSTFILKIPII